MRVARLIRALWALAAAAAAVAAWESIRVFGAYIGPWAAGLIGVAAVMAIHPAVIGIEMLVSRALGDATPDAHRLSAWRAVKMFDAELDASIRGLWFATPWLGRRPAARPPVGVARRPLPILFIHGYFCNRAIWRSFMRDAAARGYLCDAITLDDPFASIDSHAAAVDAAIDTLLAQSRTGGVEATRVVLVCHSMGGLVTRAALQRIDPTRVAHVVTLGTPHRGTLLAKVGAVLSRKPCVGQMASGSAWLRSLEVREAAGGGLPPSAYTAVFTYHDQIVFPQATGDFAGAHRIAVGGCGHVALVFDPTVRRLVFERLDAVVSRGPDTSRDAETATAVRS